MKPRKAVNKYLTGRQDPKRAYLIYVIIFMLVLLIISNVFTYLQNQAIISLLNRDSVEIYALPELRTDSNNPYLPVVIKNTGDNPITDGVIHISTCSMSLDGKKYYEHLQVPILQKGETEILKLYDTRTITEVSSKQCVGSPFNLDHGVRIILSNNTRENNTQLTCGICYYNVHFESNEIELKMEDLQLSPFPIEMEVSYTGASGIDWGNKSQIVMTIIPGSEFDNYSSPFNDSRN